MCIIEHNDKGIHMYITFSLLFILSEKSILCLCHAFDIALSDAIVNDYKGNLNDYRRNMIKTQVELNQPCVKRYFLPKNDSEKFQETITKKKNYSFLRLYGLRSCNKCHI